MADALHYDLSIAINTYTTQHGQVTTDQTLRRGGITQIGTAAPAAGGGPVFAGDFSGGMPDCDPKTGQITLVNPPPNPPTKRNYIRYVGDGRMLMQPDFNWLAPDGQDGPAYLFTAFPHSASPSA